MHFWRICFTMPYYVKLIRPDTLSFRKSAIVFAFHALCNVLPCTSHPCNDVQFLVRYPAFFDMSCEKTMLNSQIAVS